MNWLPIATQMADGLIKQGMLALEQRAEAIAHMVESMNQSPPDIDTGYFDNRDAVLGDSDELTRPTKVR